jgi:hypothetical protein
LRAQTQRQDPEKPKGATTWRSSETASVVLFRLSGTFVTICGNTKS